MGLHEHKKIGLGVSLVAIFGAIATAIGFYSDIESIFSKSDNNTKEVIVTSVVTQKETQTPAVEEADTELAEDTEEVTTTPRNPEELYLHNIEPTQSENFYNSDSETDTIGNQYTGNVQCIEDNGYAIYYVGGKYSKLQGIIAANSNRFSSDQTATITILLDDEEVYSTGEFSRVSTPMQVDIDVSGVQWIKIQHSGTNLEYDHQASVILANFKFVE